MKNETNGNKTQHLRLLYVAVSYLSMQMVVWILVTPATWLFGHSSFHTHHATTFFQHLDNTQNIGPAHFMTKFIGQHLIQATHILPSAVWTAIVPFQLNTHFRKRYPQTHKRMGYVFLVCSVLNAVGVLLILGSKDQLLFDNFILDLPGVPYSNKGTVMGITLWFSYTALRAWHAVLWRRNIPQHQRWMLRHVASGIWTSLIRFLLMTVAQWMFPSPTTPSLQRAVFGDISKISFVVCVAAGEYAIHLVRSEKIKG